MKLRVKGRITLFMGSRQVSSYVYQNPSTRQRIIDSWKDMYSDDTIIAEMSIVIRPDMDSDILNDLQQHKSDRRQYNTLFKHKYVIAAHITNPSTIKFKLTEAGQIFINQFADQNFSEENLHKAVIALLNIVREETECMQSYPVISHSTSEVSIGIDGVFYYMHFKKYWHYNLIQYSVIKFKH